MSQPELNFDEPLTDDAFAAEPSTVERRPGDSQIEAPRGVLVRRPRTTIYTALLGISAAALAIACLLMLLEIWHYGAPWTLPWKITD